MTAPHRARPGLLAFVAAVLVLASCSGSDGGRAAPPAMSERFSQPTGEDLSRYEQFFPDQPGAIGMVERQMLWGWDQTGPYGWRNRDGRSVHTVVTDGRRGTYDLGAPDVTVWMFGGSTTFGVGQSQSRTIASDLVKLAQDQGVRLRIVNFGVSGYVNWQEASEFADQLAAGPAPDLAVFFDGANDVALAVEREAYGLLGEADTYFLSMSDEQRRVLEEQRDAKGYEPTGDLDRAATVQAAQYRRGVELARQAGEDHGVPTLHLWQPDLYTISPEAPRVREALDVWDISLDRQAELAQLSDAIRERSGVDPIDLSGSLDDATAPIFFDISHSNEYGAQLQAEAIWPHLQPMIGTVR